MVLGTDPRASSTLGNQPTDLRTAPALSLIFTIPIDANLMTVLANKSKHHKWLRTGSAFRFSTESNCLLHYAGIWEFPVL